MGLFSSIGGILGGAVGSIFGPVGTVIGSGLGGSVGGAVDSNQANKKAEGYYNQQMDFAREQAQFQQDYAKHVMEWRVEDAKNAGVHPMAALGISNPSYSPVSAPSAPQVFDSGQFDTGSTFGQSLNRASFQMKTVDQQQQAAKLGFDQIALQNKGLELDNQFKALQVAQLASELQRNAASSAPSPTVGGGNSLIGGQNDVPYSLDTPYGKSLYHLFTVARHGDTLVETPHPDIADSITETEWKNILASIDAEAQAQNGTIKPPVYLLSPSEQEAVRSYRYELVRIPGVGWKLDRNPSRLHPYHDKLSNYEKFKRKNTQRWDGKQSVSGKIF